MFSALGLFRQISCSAPACRRINCPFSHLAIKSLPLPSDELRSFASVAEPHPVTGKRPHPPTPTATLAPPSKIQRTDVASRPSASLRNVAVLPGRNTGQVASFSTSTTPKRAVEDFSKFVQDIAATKVPFGMRQALFATMYTTGFKDLYHKFHERHPNQAFDDAVAQEAEVYAKSNKTSYKNVSGPARVNPSVPHNLLRQ